MTFNNEKCHQIKFVWVCLSSAENEKEPERNDENENKSEMKEKKCIAQFHYFLWLKKNDTWASHDNNNFNISATIPCLNELNLTVKWKKKKKWKK